MGRRLFAVAAAFILIVGQAGAALAVGSASGGPTGSAASAPIDKRLLTELDKGSTRFIVEFTAKSDLRAAAKQKGHAKRAKAVFDALTATARTSQAAALQAVKGVKGADARSYWLTNSLIVTGDAKLAKRLASIKGVSGIHPTKIYPLVKPVETKTAILAAAGDPEWGVEKIGADQVWDAGITGAGIVVASIDTGVDFSHPALVGNYRGNNQNGTFTHDYNWWDPSGSCSGEPCDNVGHGTHTMGTIAGGDGPGPFSPDIGVAPGAAWISAKGCEDFGCTSESLLSSGQFVLAPTDLAGNNPNPALAPDLVSNSWGSDDPNDTFYLETVQAWRAAGIIPVFAAGNAGDGCGTAGTPGNFAEVISLGATDITDNIAPFSSRGPSPTGKVSPNVSAPGVDVVSSVPGGGYEAFSGTSMATPHAAGAIALMLSSKAALLGDVDAVLNALNVTAIDRPDDSCGTPDPTDDDPNFVYGEGRIDAKAAVDLVKSGGTLSGTVTDVDTSAPVGGARVVASNGDREFSTTADAAGDYSLFLAAGDYAVTARAFGYAPQIAPGVGIVTDATTDQDFALDALPRFTVSGHVTASEDGSPIENASIVALGTPVPAATSDAAGAYSLQLPIGDYTLRASAGGCTEVATADISLVDANITQDFSLFRKLDDFGHGCRAIAFDWIDASTQTGLYGDEFAGRLRLPFSFEFYGKNYSQIFLSDNGYLNFLAADQYNSFPIAIPTSQIPNAAIYPFWQDLLVDDQSSIDYQTVGDSPNQAFVIEYSGVKVRGTSARVSFEIKLWEDGRIDMLYGLNPASPGDGRNAGIGIENETGTDALQFSFLEDLLGPNTAFRYERVPSGLVHGVVTDVNDDLPVGGARVTATPGGRTATTAADGTYSLRLRPGTYSLTASATNYVTQSVSAVVIDGGDQTQNFALDASIAVVAPTEVSATVDFGETTTANVTLSNDGSAPLVWTARERNQGVVLPPLPTPTATIIRKPNWARQPISAAFPRVRIADTPALTLSTIISDPAGDSLDANDVTTVRAGSDGAAVASMAIDFAPPTPMGEVGGYVYFDIDQDPSTGLPAEALFGSPTQDIGMEFFATLFETTGSDPIVPIWDAETFELVAVVAAMVVDHTIQFDMPLEALGGDDGFINTAMVVGFQGPSDWAPDDGHGTIEPFSDVPWLSETPESGVVGVGLDQVVTLNLGTANLSPGEYHALVVFVTNAPKQTQVPVAVTLTVTLPANFGAISGTVTDAHTGNPLGGAVVVVHTTFGTNPLLLTAATGDDGSYAVTGPAGTWTADFSLDGYVTDSHPVTIVVGVTTPGVDAALHRLQPHAQLEGGPFTFILTEGRDAHGTINLSNPDGHTDLDFHVGERPIATATNAGHTSVVAAGVDSHHQPAGRVATRVTPSIVGQPTLVLMDTLPWDSDALLQVLDANGIAHDQAGSAEMGTIDLTPYKVVFIANDQSQVFYDAYLANFDRFDAYVQGAGILWFEAAAFGLQDGNLEGVQVPGGLTIHGPQYEDQNVVVAPDHPLMVGVPNPFNGTSASHTTFSDLPAGATVIAAAASDGKPTLVEYDRGDGHVIALAQTLEFAWEEDQDGKLILENGVPYAYAFQTLTDVPWLTVAPTDGSVAPDGNATLNVSVDTTGLTPGLYRASVVVITNDPDHAAFVVPVTLVVPAYQQGVNAGGGSYTNANGDVYAADRAYTAGSFGYLGSSSTSSRSAPIAGTAEDRLYQDLRTGMTGYRFDLANGHYRVDLAFAEILLNKAGGRIFSVSIEGTTVVTNLDVFATAGGKNVALDRSFEVDVSDGHLDIAFTAQRGDKPIINAILVTELPPGSPGL